VIRKGLTKLEDRSPALHSSRATERAASK
jgi:hypothetical protein